MSAATPKIPPMAAQQGISGDVRIVVSLDADSQVTRMRIFSSPSAILNRAALDAAKGSTYQTEVRNCAPVAADFLFTVRFVRVDMPR